MFTTTSRYANIEIAQYTMPDGRQMAYVRRRFIPASGDTSTLTEHIVTDGERLDNITARYLGDPEQFWRLCDVNTAMRPNELTEEIGRHLKIPLPQGR